MKKLSIFMAMAAVAFGFTSCEEDHDSPVYQAPTEFVLNTPGYAGNPVYLVAGSDVVVTCSQPDYGYSAVTNYSLDVSLTEDFTVAEDGTPNYYTLVSKKKTLTQIAVDGKEWATAVLTLLNINTFEQFPEEGVPATKVYVRALAELTGVESSKIYSNTIEMTLVPYNPYSEGGRKIYICGLNGKWGIDSATEETYADRALTETAKGSNIYLGAFDANAGNVMFRFYTELGNWGSDGELPSIGCAAKDGDNMDVAMPGEMLTLKGVPGKGNWNITGFEGGYLTFTVDLNDMDNIKVTVQKGDFNPEGKAYIYLVGEPSAWSVDASNAEEIYANFRLYDWKGDGVYSGTFNVPADKTTFRFYTELGSWGSDGELPSIGAQGQDSALDFAFPADGFTGACVAGKGSWHFTNWPGGMMKMEVDINNMTVKFTSAN